MQYEYVSFFFILCESTLLLVVHWHPIQQLDWWRSPSHSVAFPSTDGTNDNILNVDVDTSNPTNAFVECTFFQLEYTCTIDYGTDLSYTNLVHRDTSSTQGRMATITLSEELERNTTYYYIVSVISNTQCVRVQGRFRTGEYMPPLFDSLLICM